MIEEIQALLESYFGWLRDNTSLRQVADWVEITTPYLDRHNDHVQIYARRENGSYVLTDDGFTLEDLQQSGCSLDSPKRQHMLRSTLNGFGVQANGEALEVRASPATFAIRKHNLVQAMLAVNDLFFLASPFIGNLFLEDVEQWLDLCEIRYTPRVKFAGKTGFDYIFHFVVPKSRRQPERLVQAINRPNKEAAKQFVLAYFDTREARPVQSSAYAFLNDAEQSVSTEVSEAFQAYDVRPVLWSRRDEVREVLAA
jgi:hypothetical protein